MAEATLSRNGIAYVHWGNSWQLRSYQDFRHYIDDLIYIHDLPKTDLSSFAAVVVPMRWMRRRSIHMHGN